MCLVTLDISDHPVPPKVRDLDLQMVLTFLEQVPDVTGPERRLPQNTGLLVVVCHLGDVLHGSEIHEYSSVTGECLAVKLQRRAVDRRS